MSFQNNNGASKKKSSNFHAKTLAEIKHSLSQFERTEQAQQAQMGRPVSSLSTTSSNGNYSDYVNYLMNFGYDEVRTVLLTTHDLERNNKNEVWNNATI